MMKHLFFLLTLAVLLLGCNEASLVLVDNGKPNATIILPADSDSLTAKASIELQKYLELISGAQIPISDDSEAVEGTRIFVGAINHAMQKEQILIESDDTSLTVRGGDSMSTLYAVYTFLEEMLDCRFYAPDYEFIPKEKNIAILAGLKHDYVPPITTRTVHSRLYYDNHDFANKRKVTYEAFPGYVPGAGVHTFHRFVPAADYLQDHPEYYALRNGKRLPTQLCLTNEAVLDIVIDVVDSLFRQYPNHGVLSVSQDDNTQHCQCAGCASIDEREGTPAGSMIAFVNKVAEKFPERTISTLAYQYTRTAPKSIKPRENVLITLCSIECDRSAPIDEKCVDFSKDLKDWAKLTNNVRIWDYTTQFTNFLAPFPNLHTLQANVQLFEENNAKWVFEQHSSHPSELFELRSYLTAKLLWDPTIDQDQTIEDFLAGYYETAAPFVQQYISTVHQELQQDSSFFLFLYGDPSQGFNSFLRPELLQEYDKWYDQAEKAIKQDPDVLERIRRARLSVDYAILEAARMNDPAAFSMTEVAADGSIAVAKDVERRLERFLETCQDADIEYMNEMRFTVDEYASSYQHTMQKAGQANIAKGAKVRSLTQPKKYANEDPQVLTDGAYGGASFFANWLGYEGNSMEAIIDLDQQQEINTLTTDFLQVVNHVVFFPVEVTYYSSTDGDSFTHLGTITNKRPLSRSSKINDMQTFQLEVPATSARYVKVVAKNMNEAPEWHHAAGLPSWIFVDEVIIN